MDNKIIRSFIFLAVLGACASSHGQKFRITDLGALGAGDSSSATGINNSGQIACNGTAAFLYSNGSFTNLGSLGGGDSSAIGVNASGQVVGESALPGGFIYPAFLYSNGTMQNLGILGSGSEAIGTGINASGIVVGWSDTSGGGNPHAFIYSAGMLQDLGTFGGESSYAYAINTAGQIVGYSDSSAGEFGFIYQNGGLTKLPTIGGQQTVPTAINDAGQVVGYSETTSYWEHAFLYSNGAITDLGILGGYASKATGINASGQIIGITDTNGPQVPFLYENGVMTDLTTLIDSTGAGMTITEVNGINDHAQIVGQAYLAGGVFHAVLLTEYFVDEPTSYSIYRGVYYSGSLSSLFSIDSDYLEVLTGPTLNPQEPPVSVIVNGTSTVASVTDLRLSMTDHVNTPGLTQTIELWDYVASAWVKAGSKTATTSNSSQTVIATNPSRFVQTGTNAIRARVSWKQTGPTLIYRWAAYMDQVVWNVSP